jgi:two-component system nitrate/nitrite response regulator NarL
VELPRYAQMKRAAFGPRSRSTILRRILGEGLKACLSRRPEVRLLAVVPDLPALREAIDRAHPDLVLVDVTQGVDLQEIRSIAESWPHLALMALGLHEQRQEVIRCGRAGFVGYVARGATIDELCKAMLDIVNGRLKCSAEISGGLLRALFHMEPHSPALSTETMLTRREGEVLRLIGRGLSNKEIAWELSLSTATVKHHVHGVLGKLKVTGRIQAIRQMREAPALFLSAADEVGGH